MAISDMQAICPCCGDTAPVDLGQLQDATQFAGTPTSSVVPGGSLYRCGTCSLKFRFPIESEARYNELYGQGDATIWTGDVPRPDWDLIVDYLGKPDSTGIAVLDFGCNTGGLLARLPENCQRFGVEINRAAARLAETQHNARVWHSLDAIPAEQRFDVIVAVDVVEHVSNPRTLIKGLLQHLTEHGRLILTTGDADNTWWNRFGANWWYCFHPEHIAFISKPWLEFMESRTELRTIQVQKFRYRQLGPIKKFVHGLFMLLFGLLPSIYLSVRNTARRIVSRPNVASVLGNGVSADHIFVVLSKSESG